MELRDPRIRMISELASFTELISYEKKKNLSFMVFVLRLLGYLLVMDKWVLVFLLN
jgi:hypothetical protein